MNRENNFEEIQPIPSATIPLPVAGKDMNSILKSLETGVENIFTGDKYAQYLQTMSKFHRYSFNNTLLIAMQRPDATLVTGYRNWQSMGRQVKKGEKGITILAPAPIKRKREQEILDQNRKPLLDADGKPRTEEVEVVIPRFKPTTVFDISQTDGEPIETLAPEELTEAVADYDLFMEAITAVSPVPIRFDEIAGEAKGYYHSGDKEIVIQKGMSESQTIKTAIHETGHARLHDKDIMEKQGIEKDRLTKEVEAESVAYCVCSAFGVDTSEYSFPYIAGWSSNRDMKELKASMDIIRKTAGEMIDELSDNLQELFAEKKQLLESEQKQKLIPAMEAAGYHFDELESTDGNLRFLPDGTHEIGGVMISDSWNDVKEWLEGVVLEDPDTAERVARVMHPERYEKTSEELMFAGEERYALYQLNTESKDVPYEFMGMDFVKDHGMEVTAADYKCVYSGILHDSVSLDELYSIFNQNHPADFKGHSMSVSDVVIVNRDGDMKAYYVDSFGFADLPDFVRQRQEMLGIESPESHLNMGEKSSCISFYVAECSEFPVLGEFHQDLTLEQAFELFDKIPGSRMNGIKSIGFNLQDGSDYEGMFDLYVGRTLQKDIINSIPGYRDNKLVQKAISDVEKIIEKRQAEREKPEIKKPEELQKEKKTKSQHRREAMSL
jgi:antirestriction protein ArdC